MVIYLCLGTNTGAINKYIHKYIYKEIFFPQTIGEEGKGAVRLK